MNKVHDHDYVESLLTPHWKGREGEVIRWIHFNVGFLANICRQLGFYMMILLEDGEDDECLLELRLKR